MNKRKKYAVGTKVHNYIETPNQALNENALNMDISMIEGMTDPFANILGAIGDMGMQVGTQLLGSQVGGIGGDLIKGSNPLLSSFAKMAFGGDVNNIPVEVEGKEVGETPNGTLLDFIGPSHEQGGINISLPEGTEMFSKRIKIDGVSMADRKKKRKKKEVTLEDLLSNNTTDELLKNSLNRTKTNNKKEDNFDKQIQDVVKLLLDSKTKKQNHLVDINDKQLFQGGGTVRQKVNPLELNPMGLDLSIFDNLNNTIPDLATNPIIPQGTDNKEGFDLKSILSGETDLPGLGDMLSMFGTAYSAFAPMNNTKANRAGDTPNINAFENFGEDALKAIEETKDYVNIQKDNALSDIQLSSTSQMKRNRNSARGINQMRALDLATNLQDKRLKSDVNMNVAQMMQNILSQQAQLENQQDSIVMQGEQNRDLADRQDRDNFYSQLAQDIATKGQGIQELGKDFNQMNENDVIMNLLNQFSKYGIQLDNKGKLKTKKSK